MFESTSLPLRAAIASLLGSLFGLALILSTHNAQAQTLAAAVAEAPATKAAFDGGFKRLGEAALLALRKVEPTYGLGDNTGAQFVRLGSGASEPASGLRWQVTRMPGWRSGGEIPRSHDLISLGVQVRF